MPRAGDQQRQTTPSRLRNADLGDTAGFAIRLHQAFRGLWRLAWQA
jgi:hypothetical protein